jgi:hypothetical protein
MCFQMFMRLAYFYFDSKRPKCLNKKTKKEDEAKITELQDNDYFDQINAILMDIKFLAMT